VFEPFAKVAAPAFSCSFLFHSWGALRVRVRRVGQAERKRVKRVGFCGAVRGARGVCVRGVRGAGEEAETEQDPPLTSAVKLFIVESPNGGADGSDRQLLRRKVRRAVLPYVEIAELSNTPASHPEQRQCGGG
jgi:hypothetical protein